METWLNTAGSYQLYIVKTFEWAGHRVKESYFGRTID